MYSRASMRDRLRFQDNVRRIANARPVRVGTGCSGTDLFIGVLRVQSIIAQEETLGGTPLLFDHVFSCDTKQSSLDFIVRNWSPALLFTNLSVLTDDTARDIISGGDVPVPPIDLWVCGFECDNYSNLNAGRADGPGSLCTRRGSSGTSGVYCVKYIVKRRPQMFILENVRGFGFKGKRACSDLAFLKRLLGAAGYAVHDYFLDSRDYGVPQYRPRYYLLGYAVSKPDENAFDSWPDLYQDCRVRSSCRHD